MALKDKKLQELPILNEVNLSNLYPIGEFQNIVITELNNEFDKIDTM